MCVNRMMCKKQRQWSAHEVRIERRTVQICISLHNTKTIHTLRFWLIESFVLFCHYRKKKAKRKKTEKTNRFSFYRVEMENQTNIVNFLTLCTFRRTIVNLSITKWIYFYSVAKYPLSVFFPSDVALHLTCLPPKFENINSDFFTFLKIPSSFRAFW